MGLLILLNCRLSSSAVLLNVANRRAAACSTSLRAGVEGVRSAAAAVSVGVEASGGVEGLDAGSVASVDEPSCVSKLGGSGEGGVARAAKWSMVRA